MASLLELARVVGVGAVGGITGDGPCCAACERGAGACACADVAAKTAPDGSPPKFDEDGNLLAVGAGDVVVADGKASSGPGFFTGLAFGVLAGGALSALLYVGLSDEGARKASLARRRRAGYAY
jgi:hypothetical protein